MLYVSTRDDRNPLTAYRVLHGKESPDGGMYAPFHSPGFSAEELDRLLSMPFGQCVAEVLNLLFGTTLSGWDVEFAVGRRPVRIRQLGHRVLLAEAWHNPDWCIDRLVSSLSRCLTGEETAQPGEWLSTAIGCAVMFGIVGQVSQSGRDLPVDMAVVSGDFSLPMSAWYARSWGLPIGDIVCCCNENGGIWELFRNGVLRTDAVSLPTPIPEADVTVPRKLERLIYACGGTGETRRFLDDCRMGRSYYAGEKVFEKLRAGMVVSVVSTRRALEMIPGIYRTNGCLLSPCTALAYGGLMDHRAKKSGSRNGIVFSGESPARREEAVARAMGIPVEEIKKFF